MILWGGGNLRMTEKRTRERQKEKELVEGEKVGKGKIQEKRLLQEKKVD